VDVLRAGEVAVPVSDDAGGTATAVRPGDRVGVLAGASDDGFTARPGSAVLVADHLRVLTIENADGGMGGDATVTVVVATSRSSAIRIARFSGRPLLLIADQFP
jgi:Flp pilus assembly protein CpaB